MILLGLGSNMGDRVSQIESAVDHLNAHPRIVVERMSSLYETEPFGFKDQDAFLNAVCRIKTDLSPEGLLIYCQSIEDKLERRRVIRWGPRTIDLDLLIFDRIQMATAQLTLPHPYLAQRRFVLAPMAEITDDVVMDGCTPAQLLELCGDAGRVAVYRKMTEAKEIAYVKNRENFAGQCADRDGTCAGGRSHWPGHS